MRLSLLSNTMRDEPDCGSTRKSLPSGPVPANRCPARSNASDQTVSTPLISVSLLALPEPRSMRQICPPGMVPA